MTSPKITVVGSFAVGLTIRAPKLPIFGETIEVRVVNVEAVVTDKRGNRVPDLKPQDFRLKVDGKPVKVDYFNEVRAGQAIAREPGAAGNVVIMRKAY